MNNNLVTEQDIRMPQFRDAKLEDLEFDASGEVVRKDRFEKSMRRISSMMHGVNGLSARSGWTCEQVVNAVEELKAKLERLKSLILALELAPQDAEFYNPESKEYVKNIDKDAWEKDKKDSNSLIGFESCKHDEEWSENSAWFEYINVLVSIADLKAEISSIARGANEDT